MMKRGIWTWLLLSLATASLVGAQPRKKPTPAAAAEALNDEGKALIKVVDFEGATDKFRQALALVADPRYYFNLCYTLEKLGKLREAHAACDVVVSDKAAKPALVEKAKARIVGIDAALKSGKAEQAGDGLGVVDPGDTLADDEPVQSKPDPFTGTGDGGQGGVPAGGQGGVPAGGKGGVPAGGQGGVPAGGQGGVPAGGGAYVGGGSPTGPNGVVPIGVAPYGVVEAPPPRRTQLGFKFGISRAAFTADMDGGIFTPRAGVVLGAGLTVPMRGAFGLDLEALLASKGTALDPTIAGVSGEVGLSYFNVLAAARLGGNGPKFRPYGLLGPMIGFLFKATDQTGADAIDSFKRLDLEIVLAGGVAIMTGRRSFSLELRYEQSLGDIDKSSTTVQNSVLSFIGGYEL